jgi:hypothetical protein
VIVSVLPLIVPGPETTLNVTGSPELAVADNVIGETGYVTGEVTVKLIVCDAFGIKVTFDEADTAVFAWLVAVTVTVCCVEMVAGAVYKPDELIVPVPAGLIVQVTAVLLVLVTVAVNCCACPP